MTRKEAISIMNVIIHMLEPQYDNDRVEEAVEMAIKALEDIGEISKALDAIADEECCTYGYDDACQKAGWWVCDNDCEHCKWVTCIKMEESEDKE